MIDAAAIDRLRESPLMIACISAPWHEGKGGTRLPSTNIAVIGLSRCSARAQTALSMAAKVAGKRPISSISREEASPIPKRCGPIISAVSIRLLAIADNFLESVRPFGMSARLSGAIQNAAATTGPAQGPRPASSTPITMASSGQPASN